MLPKFIFNYFFPARQHFFPARCCAGGSDGFAGLPADLVHSAGTLAVQGSHALILADEAAAASLHAEHMLPWGDQITCDRFDARLLLDPSDASSLESRVGAVLGLCAKICNCVPSKGLRLSGTPARPAP